MTSTQLTPSKLNKIFFFLLLAGLTYLTYKIVLPYLAIIGLGLIVSVLFNPMYQFFLKKVHYRITIATGLSVATVILCVFIPLFIVVSITIQQGRTFYNAFTASGNQTLTQAADQANSLLTQVPGVNWHINPAELQTNVTNYLRNINIGDLSSYILNNAGNVGAFFVNSIISAVIFLFVLITLFPNQQKLFKYFRRLSPMDDSIDELYIKRVTAVSKAMVLGALIIALTQGILSGVGLAIAGVPYVLFWTVVITFFSLLPIGATWVNIPIAVVLLLLGQTWQGLFIIIYHFVLVNNIDNVLRVKLVPKEAELPGVLTLVSILGGLQVFKYWGFIYGPVVMILFITTLEVYLKYYHATKSS